MCVEYKTITIYQGGGCQNPACDKIEYNNGIYFPNHLSQSGGSNRVRSVSPRSKAEFSDSSLEAALGMLQLVELICGAKIVVTAVVRRPDESSSPTSMEDGVVRIGIRAIFRANGEGMPRLLVGRVNLGGIRSAEGTAGAGMDSRVI